MRSDLLRHLRQVLLSLSLLVIVTSCSRQASVPPPLVVAPDLPTAADASELRDRLLVRAPALATQAADLAAPLNTFTAWSATYAAAADDERPALIASGLAFASARRAVMRILIEHDPEFALKLALDPALRAILPASFIPHLERPVATTATFEVDISCDVSEAHTHHDHSDHINRTLHLNAVPHRAFVYGRRLDLATKAALPVHGIALDDLVAIADSPVQRLPANPDGTFPYQIGEETFTASTLAEINLLEADLIAEEAILGPDGPVADSIWTEGAKTILVIRVAWSDSAIDYTPVTLSTAQSRMESVDQFYRENSNNQSSLTSTFTPVVRLTRTAAEYGTLGWTTLLADARAGALAIGFSNSNYTFYTVVSGSVPGFTWGGRAFVGGTASHIHNDFSLRVISHELGHNFGLQHANYNYTSGESPVSRSAYAAAPSNSPTQGYGNRYDMMSASGSSLSFHFSGREKALLDWVTPADAPTIVSSGIHRIYRHDHPDAAGLRVLRIPSGDATRPHFWLSHRRQFTTNTYLSSGLEVTWGGSSLSGSGHLLIDTTPFSNDGPHSDSSSADNNDKVDAALTLGRMFGSPDSGAWFTVIGQGGTAPAEYLDVSVRVGNFSRNRPPVPSLAPASATLASGQSLSLTASATDSDGDTVVYSWDFGDGTFAGNLATVSKSWSNSGHYVVRVIAVDQKGGTSSARCVVRVGSPTTFTASGRILSGNQPVEGARVHNSLTGTSYRGTRTDSQGYYTLPGIPTGTYTLVARKEDHVFASSFTNPVAVSADAADLNFTATTFPAPYFIVDNADTNGVEIVATTGSWSTFNTVNGFYGTNFINDANANKGQKQVTFRPDLPAPGLHRVYIRYTSGSNRATNVPVDISHLGGVTTHTVDQTANGGAWNYLGTYLFATGSSGFARIRTTNTNGFVAADAFKFEPTGAQEPAFRLQAEQPVAAERGLSPAALRIEREGPLDFPLTVYLATDTSAEDGATQGLDFTALPAALTFAANIDRLTVNVTPIADTLPEGDESLTVSLQQPPRPTQEWDFNEPDGTLLTGAANSIVGGLLWSLDPAGTTTTGSGVLRIRRNGDGISSTWVVLPIAPSTVQHLVLETTGWSLSGTTISETIRLGFSTGANSTITAQAVFGRTASGMMLSGEALGTGAAAILPSLVTTSTTTAEPYTFVLSVDPVSKTYRLAWRAGSGAFNFLPVATIDPSRALAALRFSALGFFTSTTGEKVDIGRIYLTTADPTQPAYVIASPSEAVVTIKDDPRDDWRFRTFDASVLDNPAIVGWAADPDGDGLNNLAEYAFGRAPLSADSAALTPVSVVTIGNARHLAIGFLRRADDPGLLYFPEATGNLAIPSWPDAAIQVGEATDTADSAYEQVLYRDPQTLDTNPYRFLRVRVSAE